MAKNTDQCDGVEAQEVTETDAAIDKLLVAAVRSTKEALAKQTKVKIIISDSIGPYWEGFINGHPLMIKTGETVEVPEGVALLIECNAKAIRESEKNLEEFKSRRGKKVAEM